MVLGDITIDFRSHLLARMAIISIKGLLPSSVHGAHGVSVFLRLGFEYLSLVIMIICQDG